MKKLEQFNIEFPDSKFRIINPEYVGDDNKLYQKSKSPINDAVLDYKGVINFLNTPQGKQNKYRIGWIVPKDYIVVDADNMLNAKILFDVLQKYSIKFSYNMSKRGGHFIFRNDRQIKNISAGQLCGIGIEIDIRCNNKGYIILPTNDSTRKWGTISSNLNDIPQFLVPLKSLKKSEDFIGLTEGSRNSKLYAHYMNLKDYAPELSEEEKVEIIKIINESLFKEPIDNDELDKTVLRVENIEKPSTVTAPYDEDDVNKLERLADKIIRKHQIITVNDNCYLYNGKYYRPLMDIKELERIIHFEYARSLRKTQREEVINYIKLKSWIHNSQVNMNWNEIVFNNGVYNINDDVLYPHSPTKYNTLYIDRNYNKNADYSPAMDAFFNSITNNDAEKKTLLYEIVGYSMIKKIIFPKMFIFYGEGSTGKSTYLDIIRNLVSIRNCSFITLSDIEQNYIAANFYNKLVNLGDDISYKGLRETDTLKKLISGEMLAAQQKYKQEQLNFSNFSKLLFTTNRLPQIDDRSSGFSRRVYIVSLNTPVKNPDPFFMDKLQDKDYEYLIVKGIEAIRAAIMRGSLTEIIASQEMLEKYMIDNSSVATFIMEYNYDVMKLRGKTARDLYVEYNDFCRESGYKPVRKIRFDNDIEDMFKMVKKNRTYMGDSQQAWRWVDAEE